MSPESTFTLDGAALFCNKISMAENTKFYFYRHVPRSLTALAMFELMRFATDYRAPISSR